MVIKSLYCILRSQSSCRATHSDRLGLSVRATYTTIDPRALPAEFLNNMEAPEKSTAPSVFHAKADNFVPRGARTDRQCIAGFRPMETPSTGLRDKVIGSTNISQRQTVG